MDIKIDSETWGAVASAAIFEQMTEETRATVMQQAFQCLLAPDNSRNFGRGETPLQTAFNMAIRQAATQAVQEHIAENEEVKSIQDLVFCVERHTQALPELALKRLIQVLVSNGTVTLDQAKRSLGDQ